MTSFTSGNLLVREFPTIVEAHQMASQITSLPDLRLVDVSATAGGAWVCAWAPASQDEAVRNFAKKNHVDVIEADSNFMNAFLSLGPKAGDETSKIGILESRSISEVLRSAAAYSRSGLKVLEIRVKRAGPTAGAFAYFGLNDADISLVEAIGRGHAETKSLLPLAKIPLVGDYRRYFI